MSYVSGFMLGASIGKAIHSMLTQRSSMESVARQQTVPMAQAQSVPTFARVAATKGRRRYRAAGLVGNHQLAKLLQEKLITVPTIQSVRFNVLTGSILITSTSEQVLDELEEFFRTRLFPDTGEQIAQGIQAVKKVEKEVESVYSDKMFETADVISNFISQRTNHLLDLRSLISLIFVIQGIYKTVMMNQRPSGPQMLWWAATLLRGRG